MHDNLIESQPDVLLGKPVIAGTRISVELILDKLANGATIEQILEAHPQLTRHVLVSVLEDAQHIKSGTVDLARRGIDEAQAADLRRRLATIMDDWNRPEMDVYDSI